MLTDDERFARQPAKTPVPSPRPRWPAAATDAERGDPARAAAPTRSAVAAHAERGDPARAAHPPRSAAVR